MNFNRTPKTFKSTVTRAALRALVLTALIGAGLFVGARMAPQDATMGAIEAPQVIETPSPTERAAANLMAQHECGDELPEGVIPGHAVIERGGHVRYASGDAGFAIWLGQDGEAGTGDEAPGTLFAFCR